MTVASVSAKVVDYTLSGRPFDGPVPVHCAKVGIGGRRWLN